MPLAQFISTTTGITIISGGTPLVVGTPLTIGASPAQSGDIRLPHDQNAVVCRNNAGSGDVTLIGIAPGSDVVQIAPGGNATQLIGPVTNVNGIPTGGQGIDTIVAQSRSVAQNGAVASVATNTPTADATMEVQANVLVTTATTHSFTVTCAYTDEGNTARVLTMPFLLVAGNAIVNTVVNTNGAVPYMGIAVQIRAKANTAVTIATTGTFTTVTYNVEGVIKRIA